MQLIIKNPSGRVNIDGKIWLQGAKNSMLNNLLLPLLTKEECIFTNVPRINDVLTNLSYLELLGAKIKWLADSVLSIQCEEIKYQHLESSVAFKTTGSKYFIPFMIHRFGEFITGPSGGDQLGSRAFEDYAESLRLFGIGYVKMDQSNYKFFRIEEGRGSDHILKFPSLGLTINSIFASINSNKDITIHNSCQEAEIDNTIQIINEMGGSVKRDDTGKIFVKGGQQYNGGNFRNMSDRNASVSYAMTAIITKGKVCIENFDNAKMDAFFHFLNSINCSYILRDSSLIIDASNINNSPQKIKAYMYPDIHSDWQPLIAPFLSQQTGISYIEEFLFPYRLGYWNELAKMGASFEFDYINKTRFPSDINPHAVYISGAASFTACSVKALDLRGGMCLILAALVAKGETIIENADEILRGYEKIDIIMKQLGVDIEIM